MFSTYEERLAQTPRVESGRWKGQRGESLCAPSGAKSKELLQQKGVEGIEYNDAIPDFSAFSESTVDVPYMTAARSSHNVMYGRDGNNTHYYHNSTDQNTSTRTNDSMSNLMMKYDDPGNFQQADILTAENWSNSHKDGMQWSANDVAQYRKEHELTWHECNDGKTMQMIPRALNADFGHLGGVAETATKQNIIANEARASPELNSSHDELIHINNMSDKQLSEYFTRKNHLQDTQPQDNSSDEQIHQNTKEETDMDKKKEWEDQLQQWRDQTREYQAKQRQMAAQQKQQPKKSNANASDTTDMDNMQRQQQQKKKKEQEMSR